MTGQLEFTILVAAGNTGYGLTSGGYSIALFGSLPYGFTPTVGKSYTVMGKVEQYSVPFFGTGYDIQVYPIS